MIKKIFKILYLKINYNRINNKIKRNNKIGVIPIIIDCELTHFFIYVEPILEEIKKISNIHIELYYGERNKNTGNKYLYYNKQNAFSIDLYKYIKGNIVFLSPHIYPKGPSSALKIVLGHGICSAKFSFHPKEYYENYNIYCVSGNLQEEKIKRSLKLFNIIEKLEVKNIGYPKSDKLFNSIYINKQNEYIKYNFDSNKKTILYAPSWEDGLSLREFGISIISKIIQNNQFNLIVKLHPCSLVSIKDISYTGGIDWEKEFLIFKNSKNYIFYKSADINELLHISDIMITDFSSVALEFLLLDKPVIYLDCPKFENTFKTVYKQFNNLSYSELLADPLCNAGRHVGLINYNYNKIIDDIEYLINNPNYKINERKIYADNLLTNKGTSSKVYAKMIIENYYKFYNKKNN